MKLRTVIVFFAMYGSLPALAEEPAAGGDQTPAAVESKDAVPTGSADEAPAATQSEAVEPVPEAVEPVGFVDENRDGVNDRFADADGDGTNDVDGQPYRHHFRSADADEDGINDLYVDADGDGVNDLDARFADHDGDGFCDNVIDIDGDGVNDITGHPYDEASLEGSRFGRVDEEGRMTHMQFLDEDGDGMHDRLGPARLRPELLDRFVDEDGDGICDGRQITGRKTVLDGEAGEHGRRGRHHRRSSRSGGMGMSK